MESDNAEDEYQGQNQHDHGINLQAGRLVSVEAYILLAIQFPTSSIPIIELMIDPIKGGNVRNMVLLEPPAPAARVLLGRALAIFSFWSAAARRRIAVRGPPGMAEGDEGRPMLAPLAAAGPLAGEAGRGEDYTSSKLVTDSELL